MKRAVPDLEVMGSNPNQIELGVCNASQVVVDCYPDCPSCPANAFQMSRATWAV